MIATAMLFYAISRSGGSAPLITILVASFVDIVAFVAIGGGFRGCPL